MRLSAARERATRLLRAKIGEPMNIQNLELALADLRPPARDAFVVHLRGGTSAVWLADWLTRASRPATPATIDSLRRQLFIRDLDPRSPVLAHAMSEAEASGVLGSFPVCTEEQDEQQGSASE